MPRHISGKHFPQMAFAEILAEHPSDDRLDAVSVKEINDAAVEYARKHRFVVTIHGLTGRER